MTKWPRIHNGERTVFSISGVGKTGQPQRINLDHYLIPQIKICSKRIKDLNVTPETIKFLKENIGGKCLDLGLGGDFFVSDTKRKSNKRKTSGIN